MAYELHPTMVGPSPSGPSELDPRVRRTRADVVAAAGQVLLEEGWDQVTHAHVANRAGYSRATLYRHWRDQADLIELALEHVNGVSHSQPSGHVSEDLVAELEMFRRFLTHRGFGPVLAALVHHAATEPRIEVMRDRAIEHGLEILTEILTRAEGEGRLHPALTVDVAASMLAGGLIHEVVLRGHQSSSEHIQRSVAAILVP